MASIKPHLWYTDKAREAARFYAALLPDSHVDEIVPIPTDTPSGPAGSVDVVSFTLCGQPFMAISGGPMDPFNHAISLMVETEDQAELDRIWDGLLEGGEAEQCGWLRDRYGLCWQVAPKRLGEMMSDPDTVKAKRVADAMMAMVKLDPAALERAYAGE